MKEMLHLFGAFFRIGLFTFGGGYAMLPMLQREVVEKYHWATDDELLDYFAIGQCTPGVIAVNTATFVGTKLRGTLGGAVATVGVVCPSVLIILLISTLLKNFADYPVVQHAFAGIRAGVCALICMSLYKLYKKGVKGAFANGIFVVSLLLVVIFDISPIIIVVAAILLGVLKVQIGRKKS